MNDKELKARRFDAVVKDDPDVARWSTYVGRGAIRFYLPLDVQLANDFFSQAVVVAKDVAAREEGDPHRAEEPLGREHARRLRELAVGARAALAFVEYSNSPEARYPTAIEQGYATAQWITRDGASKGLDASRMAVAGESVGGNMTAALALMAKERGDVTFVQQSMYYPVTDAAMNTASYEQFATGYYLTRKAMQWFWDAYATDPAQRAEITASPNQASTEQVTGLPPTYLCVDEADVLRDEGEAYAAKLRSAGVPVTTVRYNGTIHDFMLLDALSETRATRAAIDQATAFLRAGLGTT